MLPMLINVFSVDISCEKSVSLFFFRMYLMLKNNMDITPQEDIYLCLRFF